MASSDDNNDTTPFRLGPCAIIKELPNNQPCSCLWVYQLPKYQWQTTRLFYHDERSGNYRVISPEEFEQGAAPLPVGYSREGYILVFIQTTEYKLEAGVIVHVSDVKEQWLCITPEESKHRNLTKSTLCLPLDSEGNVVIKGQ